MDNNIIGCSRWNDPKAYYSQENNPTEHLLKCLKPQGGALETCGPTASVNCQASVNSPVEFETRGGYALQPEQVLTDWFNDPLNFTRMRSEWKGLDPDSLPGNEVAQWYPLGVSEVFGNRCDFIGKMTAQQVTDALAKGLAVQSCLVKPGHFIAIVAVNLQTKEFIIKDSWGGRWPQNNGFCQPLSFKEFEENVKPLNLIYYPRRDYAAA